MFLSKIMKKKEKVVIDKEDFLAKSGETQMSATDFRELSNMMRKNTDLGEKEEETDFFNDEKEIPLPVNNNDDKKKTVSFDDENPINIDDYL